MYTTLYNGIKWKPQEPFFCQLQGIESDWMLVMRKLVVTSGRHQIIMGILQTMLVIWASIVIQYMQLILITVIVVIQSVLFKIIKFASSK